MKCNPWYEAENFLNPTLSFNLHSVKIHMLNIIYITMNANMYTSDRVYYVCVHSYLVVQTFMYCH